MKQDKFKYIIILLGLLGVSAVVFGIHKENHPVFIVGLILIISVYIIIRKKLKDSIQNKP